MNILINNFILVKSFISVGSIELTCTSDEVNGRLSAVAGPKVVAFVPMQLSHSVCDMVAIVIQLPLKVLNVMALMHSVHNIVAVEIAL